MGLVAKQEGGEFELLPEGQYVARCFKVIDLGTQSITYMGETKLQHKVQIVWEILDDEVKMADGRPFAVSKTYTLSLNEKSNLYADLVAWRGKKFAPEELLGFDISNLLGAYCNMQVVHNESGDKTFANVNTIMGTKERPAPVNPDVVFDISKPDMAVFENLGNYIKGKIQESQEWQNRSEDEPLPDYNEDTSIEAGDIDPKDIPF